MNAMRMTTTTSYRDGLISLVEGVIEEALDDLNGSCADCAKALTGWCDDHAEAQARVDDLQSVLRRLYDARTDDEARVMVLSPLTLAAAAIERAA